MLLKFLQVEEKYGCTVVCNHVCCKIIFVQCKVDVFSSQKMVFIV